MDKLIQTLMSINWDFSDYNSAKYPLDINSIPWYPATFPAPIPKFLIALLSQCGDTVLDPFGGKGTTAVEALKLNRCFIYNDLNPFAYEITDAIIRVIKRCDNDSSFLQNEPELLQNVIFEAPALKAFIKKTTINEDVFNWYEEVTLKELCQIVKLMESEKAVDEDKYYVRKLAFSSILKETCSQRGHFTYITDNCKPDKSELIKKEANRIYLARIEQIVLASKDFIRQFNTTNESGSIQENIKNSLIHSGDARKLEWINDNSVDFVITSPPYLCAQDYIKTMRLTNLFYPDQKFFDKSHAEIGPRSKRRSDADTVVKEFYSDMDGVFSEICRVLKPDKYFCLIIGQGKGRITEYYDTITDLKNILTEKYGFEEVFRVQRKISHRFVRVGGVNSEDIIIFKKPYRQEEE